METEVQQVADEELARKGGEGDDGAFTTLYQRYVQRIFDFALRLTRDPDEAADVAQSTFLKAYQSLAARDPRASFKSWLFTIAHHDAIDRLRRRRRLVASGDLEDEEGLAFLDAGRLRDPLEEAERNEVARLVWEAARGLKPRDYALLDLYVRQGMDAAEIAQITGVRRESVHTMLSRLRNAFEEAFTALILLARGRSRCEELARLAGPPSPKVRRRVTKHLRDCETCQESRRRYVTAVEFLGALAPVPVLPALQDSVLGRIMNGTAAATPDRAPPTREAPSRFDLFQRLPARWWLAAAFASLVAAALLLLGAVVVRGGFGGGAAAGLHDPGDVRSTSHQVGVPSQESIVTISWTPVDDVLGYSVRWSRERDLLPDTARDLPGDADHTWAYLAPGAWYFSLRTEGKDGEWTSTVRLGPFMIRGHGAQAGTPTVTPSPTATPEATSAPARRRTQPDDEGPVLGATQAPPLPTEPPPPPPRATATRPPPVPTATPPRITPTEAPPPTPKP